MTQSLFTFGLRERKASCLKRCSTHFQDLQDVCDFMVGNQAWHAWAAEKESGGDAVKSMRGGQSSLARLGS